MKSGRLSVLVYHGNKERKITKREMARYDVIITTYGIIHSEVKAELGDEEKQAPKKMEDLGVARDMAVSRGGKLLSLAFERIILDEAHTIRYGNYLYSDLIFSS